MLVHVWQRTDLQDLVLLRLVDFAGQAAVREDALWMIGLFDLPLGFLNSLDLKGEKTHKNYVTHNKRK